VVTIVLLKVDVGKIAEKVLRRKAESKRNKARSNWKDTLSYHKANFNGLRQGRVWIVQELGFETELVFTVTKNR
jgi:hypothetical protein